MLRRKRIEIIVERHQDGYVAYPIGPQGVVVGQGDTFEKAVEDVRTAIHFRVETFGPNAINYDEADYPPDNSP